MGYIIMPALGLLYYAVTIWIAVFFYPSRRWNPSPQSIETMVLSGSLGVVFVVLALGLFFGSEVCRRIAICVYALAVGLCVYNVFLHSSNLIIPLIAEFICLVCLYSLARARNHPHFSKN